MDIHTVQDTLRNNNNNSSNNNNNNEAYDSSTRFLVCVTVMIQNPADGSCADRAHVGSARRRRERRLHSFLRHERMTVRKELAAALHHSSFRGARPETNDALRCLTKTPQGCGRPVWSSRGSHRSGFCSTPWSTWPMCVPTCRFSMLLCCRWGTNRWKF